MTDILKETAEKLGEAVANFYDRALMDAITAPSMFFTGKYRNQRVPKYLRIKVPVIERHDCCDEDGGCYQSGWLITTKEIQLFRIGTKVIKVPVMRKFKKGETIKFKRYGNLNENKKDKNISRKTTR